MKARIFSSIAILAAVTIMSCGETANNDGTATDTTGAINNSADTAMAQGNPNGQANAGATTTTVDDDTKKWMEKSATAGNTEVEFGQLAQQNAGSERVKAFGQMMVTDHTKAGDQLKSIASTKNVTLTTGIDEDHAKHKEELTQKKGAAFDKEYINMMIDGHKKVIDHFEKASKDATDPDIKNFATQTLPTIKAHLDSAQAIKKSLK